MPNVDTALNLDDLKRIFNTVKELVNKTGFVNIAWSNKGMRVEEATLSSLPQKALKAIWIREATKDNFKLKEVDGAHYEGMNRWLKLQCYKETKQKFLIRFIVNPENQEHKAEVTSSAKWTVGEMTFFLDWMQEFCSRAGLILEAKGEYVELSKKQND